MSQLTLRLLISGALLLAPALVFATDESCKTVLAVARDINRQLAIALAEKSPKGPLGFVFWRRLRLLRSPQFLTEVKTEVENRLAADCPNGCSDEQLQSIATQVLAAKLKSALEIKSRLLTRLAHLSITMGTPGGFIYTVTIIIPDTFSPAYGPTVAAALTYFLGDVVSAAMSPITERMHSFMTRVAWWRDGADKSVLEEGILRPRAPLFEATYAAFRHSVGPTAGDGRWVILNANNTLISFAQNYSLYGNNLSSDQKVEAIARNFAVSLIMFEHTYKEVPPANPDLLAALKTLIASDKDVQQNRDSIINTCITKLSELYNMEQNQNHFPETKFRSILKIWLTPIQTKTKSE